MRRGTVTQRSQREEHRVHKEEESGKLQSDPSASGRKRRGARPDRSRGRGILHEVARIAEVSA